MVINYPLPPLRGHLKTHWWFHQRGERKFSVAWISQERKSMANTWSLQFIWFQLKSPENVFPELLRWNCGKALSQSAFSFSNGICHKHEVSAKLGQFCHWTNTIYSHFIPSTKCKWGTSECLIRPWPLWTFLRGGGAKHRNVTGVTGVFIWWNQFLFFHCSSRRMYTCKDAGVRTEWHFGVQTYTLTHFFLLFL